MLDTNYLSEDEHKKCNSLRNLGLNSYEAFEWRDTSSY